MVFFRNVKLRENKISMINVICIDKKWKWSCLLRCNKQCNHLSISSAKPPRVIQCVDENKLLVLLSGHSYIQFDRICMIRIAFCCRNRMSIWIALPISQSSSINIQNSLLLYGNIDNAVLFIFIRRLSNSVIYPGQFEFFHCGMPGICESHTPNRRTVSYYFNK